MKVFESLRRLGKYLYYRFIRLKASPENLARGVALGLFISATPTFGFQTLISLFFAAVFRVNKIAAMIGAQFTNAVTAPFFYPGAYYLGAVILNQPLDPDLMDNLTLESVMALGNAVFMALWVGGCILGAVVAVIGYFVVIGIDTKAHMKFVRAKMALERLKRKNQPILEKID